MFTKLRNRFLLLNLVTISLMMLVAFVSIYIITNREVRKDIDMELYKTADSYQFPGSSNRPRSIGNSTEPPPIDKGRMDKGDGPLGRSVSFMLQTDKEWNLIANKSQFEMDSDFYKLALEEAVSIDKGKGQFHLDGSDWIFTVQSTSDGFMLVFLEITAQQGILTNLIYTFTVVGSLMLIIIFFTSRFFANRSITPVKEAFDKQKQFIADASHELKTPLAIINTNTDVLLSNSEDTVQNQAKWLHYIKSETERMTQLTNDLLYLTQMDDSRATMIFTRFDVSEAVENIILTMEAVIFEKELALDYDIEPDLTVYGNREQFQQVVMILLDNAVKYTNPKGSVTLTLTRQHNDVILAVSNTGEGIASEHLARIFDRFYRTDASRSRSQGGYGLGLAIAKSIIDQHKGKIYAKSVPGKSTTFYVHLS